MTEKRKMPVKTDEFKLTDEWEGWTFTGRSNPPFDIIESFMRGQIGKISTVVYGWNFVDEDGNPLPQPDEVRKDKDKGQDEVDRLVKGLPTDLLMAMSKALTDKVFDIPKN